MKEMLREYQKEMLSRLEMAWEKERSVMVQMPTGTGKTHLMAEVIRKEIGEQIQTPEIQTPEIQTPPLTPFFDKRSDFVDYPSEARLPVAFPQGRGDRSLPLYF